ncbi:hypothetical protein [Peribacillus butanolivorans]|uniref:hypothetical protein n=1 Tax=Peribacillus butanolivorans TaxID=421767 RepID=UPI0035DF3108
MGNTEDKCSILIDRDKETVWNAITNEDKLSQWYVPGSPWNPQPECMGESNFYINA